jgi:large subunit ribosomal protein L10
MTAGRHLTVAPSRKDPPRKLTTKSERQCAPPKSVTLSPSASEKAFCIIEGQKMPTERKNETIEELRARVKANPSFFLTDYRGLTVGEMRTLRNSLRQSSAQYAVVKNTLFGKALPEERLDQVKQLLAGPTGVAFVGDDLVAAAKALVQFANESKKLQIKAGVVDGVFYDIAKIVELSRLPSRPELLSKLVGSLKSPLYGIVQVLHGNRRKVVQLLGALHAKRTESAA